MVWCMPDRWRQVKKRRADERTAASPGSTTSCTRWRTQEQAKVNTHAEMMPDMTKAEEPPPPSMITVALDWLPNTNHTGFFVAQVRCEHFFKL